MFKYRIDDLAVLELQEADRAYVSYFARLGERSKGEAWARRFFRDYFERINLLKSNPFFYGKCRVYPFDEVETEYRSFTVGWFTVFYTVETDTFTVWHVRPSRSDFTTIRTR